LQLDQNGKLHVTHTGTMTVIANTNQFSGISQHRLVSAASTNLTSVKASSGRIYGYHICNTSATARYVKFYNKASAPVLASDVPVRTIYVPATSSTVIYTSNIGLQFGTGIAYAIVGAVADTDATAVAANDIILNLDYA
jgi:hypothetical protein